MAQSSLLSSRRAWELSLHLTVWFGPMRRLRMICPFAVTYVLHKLYCGLESDLYPLDTSNSCPKLRLPLPSRTVCSACTLPLQDRGRSRYYKSKLVASLLQTCRATAQSSCWPDTDYARNASAATDARSTPGCWTIDAQRVYVA
jgi:hypothetical protein